MASITNYYEQDVVAQEEKHLINLNQRLSFIVCHYSKTVKPRRVVGFATLSKHPQKPTTT